MSRHTVEIRFTSFNPWEEHGCVSQIYACEETIGKKRETEYVCIGAERMCNYTRISSKLKIVSGIDFHSKKKTFFFFKYVKTLNLS